MIPVNEEEIRIEEASQEASGDRRQECREVLRMQGSHVKTRPSASVSLVAANHLAGSEVAVFGAADASPHSLRTRRPGRARAHTGAAYSRPAGTHFALERRFNEVPPFAPDLPQSPR